MMRRSQPWLGTLVEITARDCDDDLANRAIDAGFAAIAHVHRAMSPQIAGSDVDRINRAAVHEAVDVGESTWQVLALADDLHRRSGGLFDCAAGCAVDAPVPRPSQRDLDLSQTQKVIKRRPLIIDLGGIAKGFAVDAALDAIRDTGALSGCVNAGSMACAIASSSCAISPSPRLRWNSATRCSPARTYAKSIAMRSIAAPRSVCSRRDASLPMHSPRLSR